MYSSYMPSSQKPSANKPQKHPDLVIEEDTVYELDEECLKSNCKNLQKVSSVKIIPEESPDAPAKS